MTNHMNYVCSYVCTYTHISKKKWINLPGMYSRKDINIRKNDESINVGKGRINTLHSVVKHMARLLFSFCIHL